jgi:putative copper export protein
LIIINNFIHDLFTGFWISTIIVIHLLKKKVPLIHGIPSDAFRDVIKVFFWLGLFSLIIIIVTGIFRTLNYRYISSQIPEDIKRKILIIKHILLGIIFLVGTYLAYSYAYY